MIKMFFTVTDNDGIEHSLRISRIIKVTFNKSNANYNNKCATLEFNWETPGGSFGYLYLTAAAARDAWKAWLEQ